MLDLFEPPKPVRLHGTTRVHRIEADAEPLAYAVTPARREALRRMNERSAAVRALRKAGKSQAQLDADNAKKREIQRQWYERNREAQNERDAKRHAAMTPEQRAARNARAAERRRAGRIDTGSTWRKA